MDTYGNIAFMMYYCSIITASSPSDQTSLRRGDEVSDHVNMSSSFSRDQTEYTSHALHTTAVMVFNSSPPDEHQLNITGASPVSLQTTPTLTELLTSTTLYRTETTTVQMTTPRPETTTVHLTSSTQKSPAVIISSPAQTEAHVDTLSALNVGDDDTRESSDPLLAGLVSAFVVIAAVVSVLIFLKFRNRNDAAEFSRLQDLPMDDMLEDAPLSVYNY